MNNNLTIRQSRIDDYERILEIYAYARDYMKRTGNPTQWGDTYPDIEMVRNDIKEGLSYVGVDDRDIAHCVFFFKIGRDSTYDIIEGGEWLNNEEYGTIHRIASDGEYSHTFTPCLEFCKKLIKNIRIDTHEDNKVMQHILEKHGFFKCGIIYLFDNTPRIAYHLTSY